jgi:hypothetical protein
MKKKLAITLFAILFAFPICANATITKDFYTDGSVVDGNYFDVINVWNSATVNMSGGQVSTFCTYQTSTLDLSEGLINDLIVCNSSNVNLTGGQIGYYLGAFDSSVVNIYGKGFYYTSQYLNGYWADNSSFSIWLRGPGTASHVVLHEIPEPATSLLFGFGLFLIKGKRGK